MSQGWDNPSMCLPVENYAALSIPWQVMQPLSHSKLCTASYVCSPFFTVSYAALPLASNVALPHGNIIVYPFPLLQVMHPSIITHIYINNHTYIHIHSYALQSHLF